MISKEEQKALAKRFVISKEEQKALARSIIKSIRPMRIPREDKKIVYYNFISALANIEGYSDDNLLQLDKVMDDAINDYKRRVKDAL